MPSTLPPFQDSLCSSPTITLEIALSISRKWIFFLVNDQEFIFLIYMGKWRDLYGDESFRLFTLCFSYDTSFSTLWGFFQSIKPYWLFSYPLKKLLIIAVCLLWPPFFSLLSNCLVIFVKYLETFHKWWLITLIFLNLPTIKLIPKF